VSLKKEQIHKELDYITKKAYEHVIYSLKVRVQKWKKYGFDDKSLVWFKCAEIMEGIIREVKEEFSKLKG